jgi:hypothetical protein
VPELGEMKKRRRRRKKREEEGINDEDEDDDDNGRNILPPAPLINQWDFKEGNIQLLFYNITRDQISHLEGKGELVVTTECWLRLNDQNGKWRIF